MLQTVLFLQGDSLPPALKSGGQKLKRGLGKGQQEFKINKDLYPVGEPIPKIESNIQVSGKYLVQGSPHLVLSSHIIPFSFFTFSGALYPIFLLCLEMSSLASLPFLSCCHGTTREPTNIFTLSIILPSLSARSAFQVCNKDFNL